VRLIIQLTYFIFTFAFTAKAQLINNNLGKAFEEQPYFSQKEVKLKKIKEIRCSYFVKKTGDIMRQQKKQSLYYFNEKGYLTNVFEIQETEKKADTSFFEYKYSTKGLLCTLRKNNFAGFTSTNYMYDSINQVIKEEYFRDKVLNNDLTNLLCIQDSLIDYETIRYKKYPNQKKKIVYNSYGNPYLDIISYTNAKGQIIEIDKKLKMTSEINETKYFYTDKNQIDSLVNFSSLTPNETESIHFKYDTKANLLAKKTYNNKTLLYNTEYLYNKQTGVVSSIILQEVSTNILYITRFETIYYD